MNFRKVWDSITETGGASYNLNTGKLNPETGYMVAIDTKESYSKIPTNFEEFRKVIRDYLTYKDIIWDTILNSNDDVSEVNFFLGFWIYNDLLYIDLSENITDFDEAYALGIQRNQIAIFDCKNKRDITINNHPGY